MLHLDMLLLQECYLTRALSAALTRRTARRYGFSFLLFYAFDLSCIAHTACPCSKVYQQLAALEGQRSALDGGYSVEIAPRHDKICKGMGSRSMLSGAEKGKATYAWGAAGSGTVDAAFKLLSNVFGTLSLLAVCSQHYG